LWKYNDINAIDPYCVLGKIENYEKTNSNINISIYKEKNVICMPFLKDETLSFGREFLGAQREKKLR